MFEIAEQKPTLRIITDWSEEVWEAVGEVTWTVSEDGRKRFCGEFERRSFGGDSRFWRPLGQRRKFNFKWRRKLTYVLIEFTASPVVL